MMVRTITTKNGSQSMQMTAQPGHRPDSHRVDFRSNERAVAYVREGASPSPADWKAIIASVIPAKAGIQRGRLTIWVAQTCGAHGECGGQ